jgi:hypothetical protein
VNLCESVSYFHFATEDTEDTEKIIRHRFTLFINHGLHRFHGFIFSFFILFNLRKSVSNFHFATENAQK